MKRRKVGVLALQGDFEAHQRALARAGAESVQVRTARELEEVDGLIIPGGESSTMLNLIDSYRLMEPLARFAGRKPVFGTCAGAILLAAEVSNPVQPCLKLMDIAVERNAYGRQLDSRIVRIKGDPARLGEGEIEAVFIRAPIIRRAGPQVEVIASYNGDPVLVEQGKHMVATFHPELGSDDRIHELFVRKID